MYSLRDDQRHAVEMALEGNSLLITGPAGSGKTVTLITIVEALRSRPPLGEGVLVVVYALMRRSAIRTWDWQNINAIVIDDIYRLGVARFALMDRMGRRHRNPTRPFGGIQMVVSCPVVVELFTEQHPQINVRLLLLDRIE